MDCCPDLWFLCCVALLCVALRLSMCVCRKQPVKETADKQSSLWGSLILAYCKHNKVGVQGEIDGWSALVMICC